jgi:hypothetical protein
MQKVLPTSGFRSVPRGSPCSLYRVWLKTNTRRNRLTRTDTSCLIKPTWKTHMQWQGCSAFFFHFDAPDNPVKPLSPRVQHRLRNLTFLRQCYLHLSPLHITFTSHIRFISVFLCDTFVLFAVVFPYYYYYYYYYYYITVKRLFFWLSTTQRLRMCGNLPPLRHVTNIINITIDIYYSSVLKVKGKVAPVPWRRMGECKYSSTHSLTLALDGGEWSASRPDRFTPSERAPSTH